LIAKINGANIYYEIDGNGEPLVLIEGLGYSSWMWYRQRELAKKFRLVIFDNRGVGASDRLENAYTMEEFAKDLRDLLNHLEIQTAHLLGVSMGGMIALEFALSYPKFVKTLVLCSTSPGIRGKSAEREVLSLMFEPPSTDLRSWIKRKMSVAFSKRFLTTEEFEKVIELRLPWIPDQASLLNQASAVARFDVLDRLHQIDKPTLIIAGMEDRVVPYENSLLLHSKISLSALHIFRHAGHLVFIECAQKFNTLVSDFINDVNLAKFKRRKVEEEC
jgi:pimeloyl-ACP methyl ester carboxylesterase